MGLVCRKRVVYVKHTPEGWKYQREGESWKAIQ